MQNRNIAQPILVNRLLFIALSLSVALTACSTPQPQPQPQPVEFVVETPISDKSGRILHSLDDPEVAAIWTNAEIARQEKKYAEASAYVESALRIIPDDPVLWSRLAELRMQLGQHALAENYAAKSNALALENSALKYRNWLIIQFARDERGDVLGAREAQVELRKYAP